MARVKISIQDWVDIGKKLGYFKESQRKGKIIFSLPETGGLDPDDFSDILKEKDPFFDVQERGESWMEDPDRDCDCESDDDCDCVEDEDTVCDGCGGENKEDSDLKSIITQVMDIINNN